MNIKQSGKKLGRIILAFSLGLILNTNSLISSAAGVTNYTVIQKAQITVHPTALDSLLVQQLK